MALTLHFRVPAIPVAQPRQRHRVINIGGRPMATNYTPTKSPANAFKATVRLAAEQAYSGPPLTCPLVVSATFVMPRPKAKIWKTRKMPRYPHVTKPDTENLAKSLLDSLTGLVWGDDAQVCVLHLAKLVAAGNEQPHVDVTIEELST